MSMRVTEASNYVEYRNSIAYEYISFFEDLGYFIVLVPNNSKNVEKYFDNEVELVVLSGGNNVNPNLYNSKEKLTDIYSDRDNTEGLLLDISIKNHIKILGICRGFHFLNVYFGGSIVHNIEHHVNKDHQLVSSSSILNSKETNSYHNQGIYQENISNDLEILAKSKDGIVEAISNKEKTILGIQWHPERQEKEFDKKLINSFIKGKI